MIYFSSKKSPLPRNRGWSATAGPQRTAAATVELAFLAPILATLMLGTFEVVRGVMIKQMLNDAARKACRRGIQPGKTNTDVTADVNDILTDNNIPTGCATITILVNGAAADVSTAVPGIDKVSVKVSIPVSSIFWAGTLFLSGSTIESDYVAMLKQG
jgi:Flp pilus assembly protein TadG